MAGLPAFLLCGNVHFRRTISPCHRRRVWGVTRNAGQRSRGRSRLAAGQEQPIAPTEPRPPYLAAQHFELVTRGRDLDVSSHDVRPGEPEQPTQKQVEDEEQHGDGIVQMRRSGGESEFWHPSPPCQPDSNFPRSGSRANSRPWPRSWSLLNDCPIRSLTPPTPMLASTPDWTTGTSNTTGKSGTPWASPDLTDTLIMRHRWFPPAGSLGPRTRLG
jgi:hypothetical protein